MSKRVRQTIAEFLCKGKPCPHHLAEADVLFNLVKDAEDLDREEESQKALDRIVAEVATKGTHPV